MGADAKLMSAVMVMASVTPATCADMAYESCAAVVTVNAAGGGGGGKGSGGGGLGGGDGFGGGLKGNGWKTYAEPLSVPLSSSW